MGRPREFDRDEALERAMGVFWLKGYRNASIGELLAAMKIQRWSMYETFGNKQELFLAALQLYRRRWGEMIAAHTAAPGPARATLVALLRAMGREVLQDKLGRGCLIANAAVELRHLDPEAARVVRGSLEGLEGTFTTLLARAIAEGDVARTHDPARLARFLIAAMNGVRDVARSGADKPHIHDLVETLLATF
jgi:TetR/AcrR family transcriptional repressor of nem operon